MNHFVKKKLISAKTIQCILKEKEIAFKAKNFHTDDKKFYRNIYNNIPIINKLHKTLLYRIAKETFKSELVPTMSFLSDYYPKDGNCPIHYDLEECYYTIIIAVDLSAPWPIYLNLMEQYQNKSSKPRIAIDMDMIEPELFKDIINTQTEINLNNGDALFFSGHKYFHWRKKLENDKGAITASFHYKKLD